jgi:hypothetical protein
LTKNIVKQTRKRELEIAMFKSIAVGAVSDMV